MAPRSRVLGIVLAGGEGKRLMPLTADRSKPAVPFGGIYRLIDFVLSNLVHGGYNGCVIAGGSAEHSVLSPGVALERGARVERSIVMDNTQIGASAVIRDAILDKNIIIPAGAEIGVNHAHDRARGFTVTAGGIIVLGKGQYVPPP